MIDILVEEIKNPFEDIDSFKAKWWDRYKENGCTLDHIQRLYNIDKITEDDYVIITGEQPQGRAPTKPVNPNEQIIYLSTENEKLWDTVQFLLQATGNPPRQ